MSDSATLLDTRVADFAAAIRIHLNDLPAEDVDDLTGGLEADLLEQASDHGGTLTLGDPELYAAELRASAGFAERSPSAPTKRRWREAAADARAAVVRQVRATPVGAWLLDFVVSLRPVWWLVRGWAIYQAATVLFGTTPLSPVGFSVLLAAVVLSVQWGRGKWLPTSWLKVIRTLVNIATVIALPFMFSAFLNATGNTYITVADPVPAPDRSGLWIDGARVSNIFAYDADGNPLSNVQLFNQIGEPLTTVGSAYVDEDHDYFYFIGTDVSTVPFLGAFGGRDWNVFPLDVVSNPSGGEPDLKNAQAATLPFVTVPSLPGKPTPTPAPSSGIPAAPPADPATAAEASAGTAVDAAAPAPAGAVPTPPTQ